MAALAAIIVAVQLRSRACQQELIRQQAAQGRVPPVPLAETQLRKC